MKNANLNTCLPESVPASALLVSATNSDATNRALCTALEWNGLHVWHLPYCMPFLTQLSNISSLGTGNTMQWSPLFHQEIGLVFCSCPVYYESWPCQVANVCVISL